MAALHFIFGGIGHGVARSAFRQHLDEKVTSPMAR